MLDRLLHRSVVLQHRGQSYRMRAHRARAEATRKAVAGMADEPADVKHRRVTITRDHPSAPPWRDNL